MTFNPSDILAVMPEIATLILALLIILVELRISRNGGLLQTIAALGLLAVMAVSVFFKSSPDGAFNGMITSDLFTVYFKVLLAGIALLVVLMSGDYLKKLNIRNGEYYGLILFTTIGMMVLASASNLITLFLGIETMSIALYILAGIRSERPRSSEAALKYMLLGAFSTGFLLYGIALIYGSTGGMTNFVQIGEKIQSFTTTNPAPTYLFVGVGLVMVGLLFKVAAVPFHFWSPDVYQGSPTPVTAFMSAGPKAAALIAFLRFFGWALPDLAGIWQPALVVIAAATMILGNVIALAQKDIKRMLAYSSISHAGYLLLAVIAAGNADIRSDAAAAMFFYLVAYYLMNIGAFTIAILVSRARSKGDYQIDDYQGLFTSHPWIAAAMAIFMISLAGIPPTAGFIGKLYVFSAAVKAGFIIPVVIAVLASVVSAFYYLRIVVYMYMKPPASAEPVRVQTSPSYGIILVVCTVLILLLGILPGQLMERAGKNAQEIHLPESVTSALTYTGVSDK